MLRVTPPLLASVAALALSAHTVAQGLRAEEVADYPGLPVALDALDGGGRWASPWMGIQAAHPPGNVSYWQFENDVLDTGWFLAHGTQTGTTFDLDTPAAISAWSSNSLLFNGGEYVDLTPHVQLYAGFQTGSIAAWVKTTSGGAAVILSASDSTEGSKEARFFLEGGLVRFDVRGDLNSWTKNIGTNNDGRMLLSTSAVNDGLWHHVAVVIEPSGMGNLYVDGTLEDRGHQGFYRYVYDLDHMSIGRNVDSGSASGQWFFNGRIDDLAIWGSPLTAAEVQALAQGTAMPIAVLGNIVTADPVVTAMPLDSAAYNTFGFFAEGGSIEAVQGARAGRLLDEQWDLTQTETYYASCLLRREDTNSSIESGVVEFSDAGAIRGQFGWDSLGTWVAGTDVPTLGVGTMAANDTYFCVFRIDAGSSEMAYLKVYGPTDTVHASDAFLSGMMGTGVDDWNVVSNPYSSGARMNQIWLTPGGTNKISLDALRLGRTWESVASLGFGPGCGGLAISRTGRPTLGGSFSVDLSGAAANELAVLTVGFNNNTWAGQPLPFDLSLLGMPSGCLLLNSADTAVVTTTDPTGAASYGLSFPNAPAAYGWGFYFQWGAFDSSLATSLQAHASNGLAVYLQN